VPAVRQKFHLSPCAKFRNHFSLLSESTVKRALTHLEKIGILQREMRRKNGRQTSNVIRLAMKVQPVTMTPCEIIQPVTMTGRNGVQPVMVTPCQPVTMTPEPIRDEPVRKNEPVRKRDAPSALALDQLDLGDPIDVIQPEGRKQGGSARGASGTTLPDKARATRGTRLPAAFNLTQAMRDFALDHMPEDNIPSEFGHFCDHHQSKGSIFVDWQAAWRTWCRNAAKFASRRNGKAGGYDKGNVFTLGERLRNGTVKLECEPWE
jgi:hypothetical protein